MTGEEMERAIEFLLQGQANLQVRMDELAAQGTETDSRLQAYADTQSRFIEIVMRTMEGLAASQARTDRKIAETNAHIVETNMRLAETNARTEQRIVETNERTDKLITDVHKRTEQLITAMHARITETDARVAERMAGSRALADETNARLAQLAAIQAETDQRLNRLTALMERIIADGNGNLEQ